MRPFQYSEINIEHLPPMTVRRFRAISETPENDCTLAMQEWLAQHKIGNLPVRKFGFDIEVPPQDIRRGKRGYEIWLVMPPGTKPSPEPPFKAFNGGLYAVMTLFKPFDNPFKSIPGGWKYLHEWVIKNQQYQGGHHQWLEELLVHEDGDDLKLFHPLVARKLPGLTQ